ncbi:DNA-binding NarL/FixJ family response regulator [Paenibacillus mucilaginosus]
MSHQIQEPITIIHSLNSNLCAATHYVSRRFEFTPRESEVYDLLLTRGFSNRQIGEALHISEKTVKNHMSKIMMKCRVNSTRELMAIGFCSVSL